MLYKNLPENELNKVMRVRFWLDGLAALMFLPNFNGAISLCSVRREFRRLKPEFIESRRENLQRAVTTEIPERAEFSLLWRYHVKRQKTWNAIYLKQSLLKNSER